MATPRGITQPHTSFIGSACQGIHHTPVTKHTDTQTNRYKHQNTKKKDTRVHYTVLTQHNPTHKQPQQKQSSMRQGPNRNNQCCPRHPTVHQRKNPFVTQTWCIHQPHTPRSTHPNNQATNTTTEAASAPAGMPPPGKNKTYGSHTLGDSTTQHPQLWANNKNSLERR